MVHTSKDAVTMVTRREPEEILQPCGLFEKQKTSKGLMDTDYSQGGHALNNNCPYKIARGGTPK